MKTSLAICLLLVAAPAHAGLITTVVWFSWLSETPEPPTEFRFATGPDAYVIYSVEDQLVRVADRKVDTVEFGRLVQDMTNGTPDTVTLTGGFGTYVRSEAFFTLPANDLGSFDGEIHRWHTSYRPGNGVDWHGLILDEFRFHGGEARLVGAGDPNQGMYRTSISISIYGRIPEPSTLLLLLTAAGLLVGQRRR